MSKIDYQALRAKAEKATCGEWSLEYGESRFDGDDALIHREVAGYIPICRIEGAHPESGFDEDFQMEQQANAEFIAAANPATVLALLGELETAKKRIAELEAEPVSQAYNLPELIEGMEVSIDVSTCDADLGNRYFGTVTEASELDTAKNGYILLVQDAEPNFDVNGNSPGTPDGLSTVCAEAYQVVGVMADALGVFGDAAVQKVLDNLSQQKLVHRDVLPFSLPGTQDSWISCSDRMPDKLIPVMVMYEDGEMWSAMWNGNRWDDGTEYPDPRSVTHWREMPAAPQQEAK
ncbi:ead/Ea22-like family protein [Escherichia coli]|uniref:ead/Ea22-like family protein n=2 Tax=Escherichia coli TaxID=562 RepID=UPI002281570E|nr:ead/Ea22-like family protein [Escherichia coli]MCZ0247262.1 ead/Ea22-like family protein [Escherichia coli]